MKRYAVFLALITAGYILGWTSSVWRFGRPPHGPGPDKMFEGIGLNADQEEAIRKIRTEEKAQREQLRTEMDEARRNFEKVLDSTQDTALLQAAFNRMSERKNVMERAHFNYMMKVHQVLTLDQIQQLGEKRPKGRPPGRHEHGPPP